MGQRQGFALDVYGWVLVVLAAIFSVVVLVTSDPDAEATVTGASPVAGPEALSTFVTSGGLVADSVQSTPASFETFANASDTRHGAASTSR